MVLDPGSPGLNYLIVPHNRMRGMWRLSVLESDSPDFLDTGDPDFCFGMPRSRDGFGDIDSDCDAALFSRGGGGVFSGSDAPGLSAGVCSDVNNPPDSK